MSAIINSSFASGSLAQLAADREARRNSKGLVQDSGCKIEGHRIIDIPPDTAFRIPKGTILKSAVLSNSLNESSRGFVIVDDPKYDRHYVADMQYIEQYNREQQEKNKIKKEEVNRKVQEIIQKSKNALSPCTHKGLRRSIRCLRCTIPCLLVAMWISLEINSIWFK